MALYYLPSLKSILAVISLGAQAFSIYEGRSWRVVGLPVMGSLGIISAYFGGGGDCDGNDDGDGINEDNKMTMANAHCIYLFPKMRCR